MNYLKLKKSGNTESNTCASTSSSVKAEKDEDEGARQKRKEIIIELGNESQVLYNPRLIGYDESWDWFHYFDSHIPWTRPTIRVFGRSCIQPRDTCYIASVGVSQLVYSGYQPHAYSWDDFPRLKDLLKIVHDALPGSRFNSVLLNRYNGGNDYVGWHSDDEKLYGPTPEISSLSFGCERDFILKRRTNKLSGGDEPAMKRLKKTNGHDLHSFTLKHGSLLVMRGYTQRDWIHSVPKRAKIDAKRINLTFRLVL